MKKTELPNRMVLAKNEVLNQFRLIPLKKFLKG